MHFWFWLTEFKSVSAKGKTTAEYPFFHIILLLKKNTETLEKQEES